MVQQLSLYGSLDDASYDLFVSTMTTVSGNPPIAFAKLSTVWIPNPAFQIEGVNTKNQLVEQTRIKLERKLPLSALTSNDDGKSPAKYTHSIVKGLVGDDIPIEYKQLKQHIGELPRKADPDAMDVDSEESKPVSAAAFDDEPWCVTIADIPAAGNNRKVSMQTINESVLMSHVGPDTSITSIMGGLGYVFQYQYITAGVKFNLKHGLVVELQKIWNVSESSKKQVTKGGFLIKAFINVGKATDIERMNFTESVLLNLQKELQGYVDLTVPDRKSMDSRMGFE